MPFAKRRLARLYLLALMLIAPITTWADHPNYTLGVFPHLSPLQIEQRFVENRRRIGSPELFGLGRDP